MKGNIIAVFVVFVLFTLPLIQAQGPIVNINALQSYAILTIKLAITITGLLVFLASLIRAAIAGLKKQVGGVYSGSALRDLYETLEGPIFWLLSLALVAWLPDILVSIGLLPQGTPFTVSWNEIFMQP
ncbi:MAG: hypothetical protein QXY49_01735 [Thermofilaceae archaeon]